MAAGEATVATDSATDSAMEEDGAATAAGVRSLLSSLLQGSRRRSADERRLTTGVARHSPSTPQPNSVNECESEGCERHVGRGGLGGYGGWGGLGGWGGYGGYGGWGGAGYGGWGYGGWGHGLGGWWKK